VVCATYPETIDASNWNWNRPVALVDVVRARRRANPGDAHHTDTWPRSVPLHLFFILWRCGNLEAAQPPNPNEAGGFRRFGPDPSINRAIPRRFTVAEN
jgi:hypothetical protein